MDRFWLKHYPAGVPADIDLTQSPWSNLIEESFEKFATARPFCMGKSITYRRDRRAVAALGAWLQCKGLRAGRARRADDAERAAVSGRDRGGAARGLHRRQRQSALHGARTRAPVEGLRRRGDHRAGELRAPRSKCCRRPPSSTWSWQHGRPAGLQGAARQLRGAPREEDGAGVFAAAARSRFNDAIAPGARMTLSKPALDARRHRVPAVHRRHDRRLEGRDAAASQHVANMLQNEAWLQPAYEAAERRAAHHRLRAAAVSHLRADRCCLLGVRSAASNILIPNPRDIAGLRQGAQEIPASTLSRPSTRCSTRCSTTRTSPSSTSRSCVSNGGGMAVQQAVAERWLKPSPAARSSRAMGCRKPRRRRPATRLDIDRIYRHDRPCRCRRPTSRSATTTASDVPLGEPGEICIRGPQVMAGYWNRPDETAKVMTPDGFFQPATSA